MQMSPQQACTTGTLSDTLTNHNAIDDNVRSCNIDTTPMKHSVGIKVDPDEMLSANERLAFHTIIEEYDDIFNPNYRGYNGHVGPFEIVVNMYPIQPLQQKGCVPQYACEQLVELYKKCYD